jgi:Carboxypeptidase regulatory-like domain
MAWVTVRCPRCGAFVAAPARTPAAASYATCPHCSTTVPIVAPRDPPPLFTWEVFPSVYPSLPVPRAPGARLMGVVGIALVVATLFLAGLAGFLVWNGVEAVGPGTFSLHGTVVRSTDLSGVTTPVAGAIVNVSGESGMDTVVLTNSSGAFSVVGIPAGGVLVNVSAPGFDSVLVQVFLSSIYATSSGGSPLVVELTPSNVAASTTVIQSPFPSLENLLASLGSAAVLLGIAAAIAGLGARAAFRPGRASHAVVGGAAALVAPAALFALGETVVFPYLEIPTVILAAVGALAVSLALVPLVWEARPTEPSD